MGRPLRTQGGEDWHFITAKSNPGLLLFRDTDDYSRFVSQLSQWRERHQVELAAYVLLPDHYHLLARFPAHNASRAMQWLNVSYGHWHQHRHEVKGHLFSRRFEVLPVRNHPDCLSCASLYLHLHPVRTMMGLSGRTGHWLPAMLNGSVAKARKHLAGFRWSSLNAWLQPDPRRSWLRPPPISDYADLIRTTLDRGLPQSPEQAFAPGGDCRKKAKPRPAPRSLLPAESLPVSGTPSRAPRPLTSDRSPTSDLRPPTSDSSSSPPSSFIPHPSTFSSPAPFRPSPSAEFRQEFLSRTLAKVLDELRALSSVSPATLSPDPLQPASSSPTSDLRPPTSASSPAPSSSLPSSPPSSFIPHPSSFSSRSRHADRDRLLALASRHGLTAADLSALTGMTPSAILRSISRVHARSARKES